MFNAIGFNIMYKIWRADSKTTFLSSWAPKLACVATPVSIIGMLGLEVLILIR